MKTNELIEKVKHLGLETKCDEHKIEINDKKGRTVCSISRKHCFIFTTDYYVNEGFPYSFKEALFRIVCQYARTPIEEREIEPKYKLALRIVNNQVEEDNQLILFWDSRINRVEIGKCGYVKNFVSYMKQFDSQPYKKIHYIYTQKEWEEKLKTSWETITFIYQPIMID